MKTCLIAVALTVVSSVAFAEEPMFRLGVNVSFDNGNLQILNIDPEGPGARLHNDTVPQARLEPGDVIEEIDGQPVGSQNDLLTILNSSPDGYVALRIRDVNSGQSSVWHTTATPTATTAYEFMRDTYRRALRNNQVSFTPFVFTGIQNNKQYVMSNLGSVLRPIIPDQDQIDGDEKFRRLLVGVISVQQHEAARPPLSVVSADSFLAVDGILSRAFDQLAGMDDEQQKHLVAEGARSEVDDLLKKAMTDWAENHNKQYVEEATMPRLFSFRVRTSIPGATVQLLLSSEKIIRLSRQGLKTRPVDAAGKLFLETSVNWTPLPADDAMAYGRYYYRLVFLDAGLLKQTPFDENRVIIINQMPPAGEILFQ